MSSRNPFSPKMEIGCSPEEPTGIGSSSSCSSSPYIPNSTFSELGLQEKMNSRSPFSPKMEIVSSSKQPQDFEIGSSRSRVAETGSLDLENQPRIGQTITDPDNNDTYILNLQIGSFSNGHCPVYKAKFFKYLIDVGKSIPYGYVTLKIVNMNLHEHELHLVLSQSHPRVTYRKNPNIIRCKKTFIAANLFCIVLPYMSEGSLRSILSTRPEKKLPENFIPVVLREVLLGLRDELHIFYTPMLHKSLSAGDIFIDIHNYTKEMSIKLAFEISTYDLEPQEASLFLNTKSISIWGAAPEVFESENEDNRGAKSDIWLLGITALELVYGTLPVMNRTDLNYIINKLREKKKFPRSLEKMILKRDKKLKKVMDFAKRKKRVFSQEFEEMVLSCLREDPDDRPTADELLRTPFFSDIERFKQFVLSEQ
uniref:Protein kinase domain-containing protein n=1 Tax=Solanum lycopersicum TaxID=4081 RepID=A0A3Q7IDN4_SOLLC